MPSSGPGVPGGTRIQHFSRLSSSPAMFLACVAVARRMFAQVVHMSCGFFCGFTPVVKSSVRALYTGSGSSIWTAS